ncbi:hypothetical protein ACWGH3_26700 [Streptomyces sp. NPDC054884]|nr:hypothetical protein [Streptomyces sp. ME08-AFT2]MDX3311464.1 hypothetical protein [Streptomyces sp. ME08-AFT2]
MTVRLPTGAAPERTGMGAASIRQAVGKRFAVESAECFTNFIDEYP